MASAGLLNLQNLGRPGARLATARACLVEAVANLDQPGVASLQAGTGLYTKGILGIEP